MPPGKGANKQKVADFETLTDQYNDLTHSVKELTSTVERLVDRVDTLTASQNVNTGSLEEIKKSLEFCHTTSQKALDECQENSKQLKALQQAHNNERLERAKLLALCGKLQDQITKIESQSRRDNLLIDGLAESEGENCEALVRDLMQSKLKIDNVDGIQLVRCHRLGVRRRGSSRPRTMIVKFQWYGDRMRVWKARRNLQGTNIYLNEDFPKEIQQKRKILMPILKKAKSLGKEAFLNVDALIIEGNRFTTDDLHKLPTDLDPAKIATPQFGEVFAFFGGQSPLSNFHISHFSVDGRDFDSVERFYTWEKAKYAKRPDLSDAVMSANTVQDVHNIGKELNKLINVDNWHDTHAIAAM